MDGYILFAVITGVIINIFAVWVMFDSLNDNVCEAFERINGELHTIQAMIQNMTYRRRENGTEECCVATPPPAQHIKIDVSKPFNEDSTVVAPRRKSLFD